MSTSSVTVHHSVARSLMFCCCSCHRSLAKAEILHKEKRVKQAKRTEMGIVMFQRRFRNWAVAKQEQKWFYDLVGGMVSASLCFCFFFK